jgi:DNA polymerase III epsilon subunit-like protein
MAFIDTETTGLDPWKHEIIEVAVIRVSPEGRVNRYQTLVRPENIEDAMPEALEANGYAADPSRWGEAPHWIEVAEFLIQYLGDCVVVGHNVAFDIGFVNVGIDKAGIELEGLCPTGPIGRRSIDTITLAREHLAPLGLESIGLDSIRDFLGWSKVGAHRAMKDAEDVRRLFNLLYRAGHRRRIRIRMERMLTGHVRST